jgi:hypothetical protein
MNIEVISGIGGNRWTVEKEQTKKEFSSVYELISWLSVTPD